MSEPTPENNLADDMELYEATVSFGPESMKKAAAWGLQRRTNARRDRRHQTRGVQNTRFDTAETEKRAIMAEWAVAAWLGVPDWQPQVERPDIDDGDVNFNGYSIEVKSSDKRHASLIVRQDDKREWPYVLVVVTGQTAHLVGWRWAHECKEQQWWRTDVRSPAYYVPQRHLQPMSALKTIISSPR